MPAVRSLERRLLLLTGGAAALTLAVAGFALSALFRDHARQQFVERLQADLDQVMTKVEADDAGRPVLDPARLSDPRWTRPGSGLYWQIDAAPPLPPAVLLRSRSLWDAQLDAPRDRPAPAELHVHAARDAQGEPLVLIERSLQAEGAAGPWRVMVAAQAAPIERAARRFDQALFGALAGLLALLLGGAVLQVRWGLVPLRRLQQALTDLREGRSDRLTGTHPAELQPLVDDFNRVLDRQATGLERARHQAGNLAHALKTPLTILDQAAAEARDRPAAAASLPAVVAEQVRTARRQVDWHLARARAAAAVAGAPGGGRVAVRPVVEGLARVMQKVHAHRISPVHVTLDLPADLHFAGDAQDLHEMLGNLLDNAWRAARSRVRVSGGLEAPGPPRTLRIQVDDDGPGIDEAAQALALRRGTRLDESSPGSGLGLAIVQELAALHGGSVALQTAPIGGLRVVLTGPAA